MAIYTFQLVLITLLAHCSKTISYQNALILQNSTSYSISSQYYQKVKDQTSFPLFRHFVDEGLKKQIYYRSKRNVRTKPETTHLTIFSNELLYKIFSPNYKWEHLHDLQFDNTNSSLCQDGIEIVTNCNVSLPQLRYLTLNYLKNCEALLDNILSCFETNQLRNMKINSQIDDDFIQQFHELLRKNNDSLNEISLSGLLVTRINVFEIRKNYTLNNVKAIFMRPKLEDLVTVSRNIVNKRFCGIFPNIVKLGIKQAAIDFDQILRLRTCEKLKYLKAVIKVKIGDLARLLGMDWKFQYQGLENIALKLVFDECPLPDTFELLTNKMSNLRRYILCSNCNLSRHRNIKCTQGSTGIN